MVPRRLIPLLALLATLLALPAGAGAVMPGENGRIVFASGRDADNDAQAKLHLLPVPGSTGGGTVGPAIALQAGQHRHPTWSPDRTRIAYARGDNATANYDIFIIDLTAPGSQPVNITNSDGVTDDRPAWSPDGTRIAYESEVPNGGASDIIVYTVATGATLNLTSSAGTPETKPAWSSDSQTIYYTLGDPNVGSGIYREPAGGGMVAPLLDQGGTSEFQISLSPDGTKFCVTIGTGFNNTARVWVASVASPTTLTEISSNPGSVGDYNCTWSPDGIFIAYVSGIFSTGELVMERADNTSLSPIQLAQDPGGDNFDGNPDWAPDGRPVCQPASALTLAGDPVSVTVNCPDHGPAYELTEVKVFRDDPPANGTATGDVQTSPATFVYTPNSGFTGTDSFKVGNFDALGFGPDGTVAIQVLLRGNCANLQTGTGGPDVLTGTFAGDRLRGLGGNDRLSGAAGNDCLVGGRGRDTLTGGPGRDVLTGGPGRNTYSAGPGNDRVNARNGRRETIRCGKGRRDRAVVDRIDMVRGCELVTRR